MLFFLSDGKSSSIAIAAEQKNARSDVTAAAAINARRNWLLEGSRRYVRTVAALECDDKPPAGSYLPGGHKFQIQFEFRRACTLLIDERLSYHIVTVHCTVCCGILEGKVGFKDQDLLSKL